MAQGFVGEYQHSLDEKGRVTLPKRIRDALGDDGMIVRTIDGCLALYTAQEWERVASEMSESERTGGAGKRDEARAFFSGAADAVVDKQGRMAIPPKLRTYAEFDRDVVIVGVNNRVELWSATHWEERSGAGVALLRGGEGLAPVPT